jgi:osmotically inducible lipoprotein OsmB
MLYVRFHAREEESSVRRYVTIGTIIGLALTTGACGGNRMDRAVTGAGIGAASGAGVGVVLGGLGVATGALIGAGVGAGVGLATNQSQLDLGKPVYR